MFYRAPEKSVCADVIPYYEDGEFKLFYLRDYRDIEKDGEGCPWCLLTTTDLVNYKDHGPVLLRGGEDEQDLYVFTGCCIKINEKYVIYYTGHNPHLRAKGLPEQKILRAESTDMINWQKDKNFEMQAPEWLEMHDFRDPFVFYDDKRKKYFMLLAGREKNDKPSFSKGVTLIASSDDAAVLNTAGKFFTLPVPEDMLSGSNNYEISFDIKFNAGTSSDFEISLIGLDGSPEGGTIFLAERGNGQYWLISDEHGHDIYNNTGDLHGGLDATAVDLANFVKVRFVHFEGYLELWINGTRRCVSHLSNFGNNIYMSRKAIPEGKITGFGLKAYAANAVVIDNIEIKEAKGAETRYSEKSAETSVGSQKIFPLSAQNLYRENFKVTGTFKLSDATKSGWFPTIKLMGLNASILANYGSSSTEGRENGREYSVNVQCAVDGGTFTPGVYAQTDIADQPWTGRDGNALTFVQGDEVTYRIEVYGDKLDFYINGVIAIQTTFTDLGLTKGRLQYVKILSGGGGAYWTDFTYDGYEKQTAVDVTASSDLVMTGEDVTFKADVFGQKGEIFDWYIDGVKQNSPEPELTLNDLSKGTHTIAYNGETTRSNEVIVTFADKMITVEADKLTGYSTDIFNFTATTLGSFEGETLKWFVNDVERSETGDTLALTGLNAGNYVIVCRGGATVSNSVTITVRESSVSIETERKSYFSNENAVFNAVLQGISSEETISWYVDGELISGASGAQITLPLAAYKAGDTISVFCKAAGEESEPVKIGVAYDVMGAIKYNENFKVIHRDVIEEGGTYGNFSVGSDANGYYLFSEVSGRDTYYTLNPEMPSGNSFILEYKLFIPSDLSKGCFVYPVMLGLNSQYPAGMVETAIGVTTEGLSPYFKEQINQRTYNTDEFGFGKDLTYNGGIAVKGDWNAVAVVVQGQNISMYINGEIVLFYQLPTASVPSGYGFNLYPDGGAGVVEVKIKDIALSGIEMPAPELESVTLSVSSVSANINETITVTANLNPFNADANNIQWYVNDVLVDGNGKTLAFTADKAGTYKIHCVIDGVTSSDKTITVAAADAGGDKTDSPLPTWAIALIAVGCAAVVGGIVAAVIIVRKKKK